LNALSSPLRFGPHLASLTALALCLMATAPTFAQSSYSVRKLPPAPVSGGGELKVEFEAISNNGDVAALSKEVSRLTTVYAPGYGFIKWPVIGYRVVQWTSDGSAARVLPVPSGGNVVASSMRGIDGSGRILASVSNLFGSTWTWWNGTQRTTLTPSLSGFPSQWALGRVNSNGEVPAYTNANKKPRVVVLSGKSTVRELPLPPDDFLKSGQGEINTRWGKDDRRIWLNDKGQVVLLVTPTMNATNQAEPQRLWFWDGKAWQNITPPPPISVPAGLAWQYRMEFWGFNNAGQVLIADYGFPGDPVTSSGIPEGKLYVSLASATAPVVRLPEEVAKIAYMDTVRLADNGDVLFTRLIKDPRGQFGEIGAATICRDGQFIDVNSLTEGLAITEWVGSVQEVAPNGRMLVFVDNMNGGSAKAVLNPK
jgi:hypothetical protein